MNRAKCLAFFILFLACFLMTLTLKYEYFKVERNESAAVYVILGLTTFGAGIFLGLSLLALNRSKDILRALTEGLGIAVVAILCVSVTETALSDRGYLKANTPEHFSQMNGHCGIYAGRTILKLLHAQEDNPHEGAIQEFVIKEHCRLEHLGYLMKNKNAYCLPAEDAIDCQIRWMSGIAEHGYWNQNTRKFFFDQVMKVWPESKKEESLVGYALKDQELELGRQSMLKQAGVDESLNDQYLLIQEKEELDNLVLTDQIFRAVAPVLADDKTTNAPYLFKFKDMQADIQNKLAKIPELEKEIQQLEGKPISKQ